MQAKTLGIIPARGGSKGVLRKNIRLVGGRPLMAYAIEAAQNSRYLTDYLVSTDDNEIAAVARQEGARVLMRPPELAADDTPMIPVVKHALAQGDYEFVVILQPTAPLRTADDIDAALQILFETGADSVVSVYQVDDHHPARMYRLIDGQLIPYDTEPTARLRQALPPVYHRNGAVYACQTRLVWEQETLLGPDLRPYIMPRARSVNIDDELDLAFADLLLSRRQQVEPA
jgi:CMP-N-acetylneuraminic acid synthetase